MYKHLVQLAKTNDSLKIVAFPCNQFGGQEPWPVPKIVEWAKEKYGVDPAVLPNFILMDKIEVNGPKTHPVFHYLKTLAPGSIGAAIKWNFTKFVVDKEGKIVERVAPNEIVKDAVLKAAL